MPSSASRPAVVELLANFGEVMRAHGWRWYVFGAQAVVAYGRPRMTADVDVTVDLAGESGLKLRIALDDDFVLRTHLLPMAHSATGVPVDVIISQPGLQEDFLARSRPVVLLERWESIDLAAIDGVLTILESALGDAKLKRRLRRLVQQVRKELGA